MPPPAAILEGTHASMAGWIGALSEGLEANWDICKERGLWGTGSPAGRGVQVGDDLFIWMSKQGLLARCRALSPARAPTGVEEVPWPQPHRYRYIFDIEVLDEAAVPHFIPGGELKEFADIHAVQLPNFPRVTDEAALKRLRSIFGGRDIEVLEVEGLDLPAGYDERDVVARAIAVRRGQAAFRNALVTAYSARCAISGCALLPVLEAAHIAPYRGELTQVPSNGLLLRADLHTLFDLHLLTVLPVGVIRTSPDLVGSDYEDYNERLLRKPMSAGLQPDPQRLRGHNNRCGWLD